MRPVKIAVLNPEDESKGLKMISLVETPAIGFEQILMSEQTEIKLEVQDEVEGIIFTPVLIPDQKIYRNINGEEFDLVFPKETIKQIALSWAKKKLTTAADINHSGQLIDGVTFFEFFLKDQRRAKDLGNFNELPDGTLFATGKIDNPQVLADIKAGKIKGVSIDGLFELRPQETKLSPDELESILEITKNFIQ